MFNIARRTALISVLAYGALLTHAQAQSPALVKLVVPYPAGGSVDTMARLLQQPLQEQLKTTVVVDNRPGAPVAGSPPRSSSVKPPTVRSFSSHRTR